MPSNSLSNFIIKATLGGVLVALFLLYILPDNFLALRPVVEFKQGETHHPVAHAIGPVSYATAVKRAAPAVVNIFTSKSVTRNRLPLLDDPMFREFFGNRLDSIEQQTPNSLGSGVIISPQGYILTNNHVVQDADEIAIMLADGQNVAAQVVGTDPATDLAVLKIDYPNLPSIIVGRTEALQVGDVVLAIGNPFGVGKAVTQGIVSATGRNRLGINPIEDFIQTDAAINPGNSGGALINAYGELVGINTAIFSQSGGSHGIGFAIPVTLAQDIMTQIIETGRVTRGWLGIEVQKVSPRLAEFLGPEIAGGVLISDVIRNGPANQAGIKAGDIIIAINDQPIQDAKDAINYIARQKPGTRVKIHAIRRGQLYQIDTTIGPRPPLR